MFMNRSIPRMFSVLFLFTFMLTQVSPAYAVALSSAEPAQNAEGSALLQFISGGHALGFTSQGMYAATGSHALHVDFVDANSIHPQTDSPANTDGKAAPLSRVSYADLWDGVSLIYTASTDSIYTTTYTLVPGADVKNIRLHYNAPLTLNQNGTLKITFETGYLTESAPIAWQQIKGERVPVDVAFLVQGQEVRFALGAYDTHHALIIDPSVTWITFMGVFNDDYDDYLYDDYGTGIAVDGSGNIYISGYSRTTWGSPVRAFSTQGDAFVAKLNSSGALQWNTFLGGSLGDYASDVALDDSGNLYVSGASGSTWGSPVRAFSAQGDAFLAKLESSGALLWNTFLGGNGYDIGYAIAVDDSGDIYMAGESYMNWGAPVRAYTPGYVGNPDPNFYNRDGFATKLNSSGALIWNTFLGGNEMDAGSDITVDGDGNIYVGGTSYQTWGSPVRAFTIGTVHEEDYYDYYPKGDAFAARLDPSSGALTWNTFLGGGGSDDASTIVADGSGNVYLAGNSHYETWASPVQADGDFFVAKLESTGNLTWNTFQGGGGSNDVSDITVDEDENIYVGGTSYQTWGSPVTPHGPGIYDAFAAKLDASGVLTTNTFVGLSENIDNNFDSSTSYIQTRGFGIAVDGAGNVYMVGREDTNLNPDELYFERWGKDAFAAKVNLILSVSSIVLANTDPNNAANVDFTVNFSELVTGVDASDFSLSTSGVSSASVTNVSGSGRTYTVTVNTGNGNGTLRLDVLDDDTIINAASDPLGGAGAGNGNFTGGQTYTTDKAAPDTRIDSHPASSSTSASASFTFSSAEVTASFECSLDGSAYTVCESPQNYTGMTEGVHTFAVRAKDPVGNRDSTPASHVWTIDTAVPNVTSIVRANSNPNGDASVDFTVTFSESVTGVNAGDFSLSTIGLSGTSIFAVSGSGATRTVTVATGSGNGLLRLDLIDNDSIVDGFANKLGGTGLGNGDFTSGETYTVEKSAPTVISSLRMNSNPTSASNVDFTVTFSEPVTGVDMADFTLMTTGITGASIASVTGTGPYTVSVNTDIGNGTIRLDVPVGATITDLSGNSLAGLPFIGGETYIINKERMLNSGFNTYTGPSKIPTSWKALNFSKTDGKTTKVKKEGTASITIVGAAAKKKTLTQTVTLSGMTGDSFTFSFWVKGTSMPTTGLCQGQVLFYNGATLVDTKTLKCPKGATYNWKNVMLNFSAPAEYTKVVIKFTYSKASGTIWFDGASLLK